MTSAIEEKSRVSKKSKEPTASADGMSIIIDQPVLARALNVVTRAVSARPMIQVLRNIKLEAAEGELTLTASNVVMTIRTTVSCQVKQAGVITIPAATLDNLVASFDKKKEVAIEWAGGNVPVFIKSGRSVNRENGLAPNEFPVLPVLEDPQVIELSANEFCRTLRGVLYAADLNGQQEARPYLQGVTMTFESGMLTMIASDGFRIALAKLPNQFTMDETVELSVPALSLREVEKLFSVSGGSIRLLVGRGAEARRVQFECEDVLLASQVLDGTYWRGLKGTQEAADKNRARLETALQACKTDVRLDAEAMLRILKRASIFSQENNNHVKLLISSEKGVEVIGRSKQGGEAYDLLDEVVIEGDDLEIGHNLPYLVAAIENLDEIKTVRFCANGANQPMTVMDAARSDIMAALSPMEEQK